MSWGRILFGAIGLALLEAFLARPGAAGNVGSTELALSKLVGRFLDPSVPAFATSSTTSKTTSPSSSAPATPTAPTSPSQSVPPYYV